MFGLLLSQGRSREKKEIEVSVVNWPNVPNWDMSSRVRTACLIPSRCQ
jgi:hypothetical protein